MPALSLLKPDMETPEVPRKIRANAGMAGWRGRMFGWWWRRMEEVG